MNGIVILSVILLLFVIGTFSLIMDIVSTPVEIEYLNHKESSSQNSHSPLLSDDEVYNIDDYEDYLS
jgi:hypothetical protein